MCTILIIINLFKTNALEDEHLLSPDKIYLCQKIDGPGFTLENYLQLTYFKVFI